mmetsp:Transcript_68489/g.216771  ORF Transcript_68489/g.216771 Transcript_68489/m.216771 type:complete len:244 (+) Transcript_68489:114-845(+)
MPTTSPPSSPPSPSPRTMCAPAARLPPGRRGLHGAFGPRGGPGAPQGRSLAPPPQQLHTIISTHDFFRVGGGPGPARSARANPSSPSPFVSHTCMGPPAPIPAGGSVLQPRLAAAGRRLAYSAACSPQESFCVAASGLQGYFLQQVAAGDLDLGRAGSFSEAPEAVYRRWLRAQYKAFRKRLLACLKSPAHSPKTQAAALRQAPSLPFLAFLAPSPMLPPAAPAIFLSSPSFNGPALRPPAGA